jgi:hypothetical protein
VVKATPRPPDPRKYPLKTKIKPDNIQGVPRSKRTPVFVLLKKPIS